MCLTMEDFGKASNPGQLIYARPKSMDMKVLTHSNMV